VFILLLAAGQRPEPLTSFFVLDTELVLPSELLGKTLEIWDFSTRFGRIIKLSPFALEDLVGALCYAQECNLLRDFHCALLRFLLQQVCVFMCVCVCVCTSNASFTISIF
jgi:hypothetical protein